MAIYPFLSGAVAFGFLICAFFFLRFWMRTRDELFVAFASAFILLGLGQAIQTLADIPTEQRAPIYLIRLAAFALILLAIARKNRSTT